LEPVFADRVRALLDHPLVDDARSRGLLGALELVADKTTKARLAPELKLHVRIIQVTYRQGLVLHAIGDNMLGFAPAQCYT
ncbi:aspartate aminotransferase family protein, partial [Pseudomonas putida]|nr:aspartate aminotransferase family protein [Pseudomonas putida]